MSAREAFARLEVELRHATAEAVVVEEALGVGESMPDLQRIDHLRQHLSELRNVLERLRDGPATFDIRLAAHDVSLGEVKARLGGHPGVARRSGEVDLF